MLYRIKPQFQKLAKKIVGDSISADTASALGGLFVVLILVCAALAERFPAALLLIPVFIFGRFVMNAMDGMIARARNTASPAGEIVNEVLDVVGDVVSFASLQFIFSRIELPLLFLISCIWLCEFIGVLGKALPQGRRRQESFLGGKPERAIWLGLIFLFSFFKPDLVQEYLSRVLWLISFFVIRSATMRARAALAEAKGVPYKSDPIIGD